MKTPYKVHLAIGQFEFVEVDAISAENAKELYDEVKTAFQEPKNTPTSGLNLKDLQRLLYKRLCNQGLQLEEVESLGTDKVYSQKDIHKILESLLAKAKREAGEDRINKEVDIRYN